MRRILGAMLVVAVANPAYAQDEIADLMVAPGGFSTHIRGSQTMSYDTNPLRVTTGEQALFGSTTSPELIIRNKTPLSMVQSDTRIDANYFDHSEFDSVDVHEKLYLAKTNERWSASVRGLFDYDTTRTSELTNYALNIPKVRSTRFGATPQIAFRPNESDAYLLSANVIDATYNNNAFTDYRIYSITPAYQHTFDPKNQATFSLRAQRYETASGIDLTSDSIGPSVGWTRVLTPRLTLMLSGGIESRNQSGHGAGNESSTINYVYSGDLHFKGRQDVADFSATRAQQPFANGTETLLTTFSVTERHALNAALSLNGSALYQYADYDSTPGVNLDHGTSAGAGLTYRALDNLDVNADYKFRREALTHVNGTVNQHIFMLGVTFHPPDDVI